MGFIAFTLEVEPAGRVVLIRVFRVFRESLLLQPKHDPRITRNTRNNTEVLNWTFGFKAGFIITSGLQVKWKENGFKGFILSVVDKLTEVVSRNWHGLNYPFSRLARRTKLS